MTSSNPPPVDRALNAGASEDRDALVESKTSQPVNSSDQMTEGSSMYSSGDRLTRFGAVGISALVALAVLLAGVTVIKARAEADAEEMPTPLVSVQSVLIQRQTDYSVRERHVGRIEAARTTHVAFESGGTVREIRVSEGEQIRKGTVIALLDTRTLQAQLTQRDASRRQLAVAVERAELDLQRELELESRGLTADQALDNARLLLDQATAAVEEMDAIVLALTIALEKSTVLAPFDGVVGARYVDNGAVVRSGEPVVTVFDDNRLEAIVALPHERVDDLVTGNAYPLFVDDKHVKSTFVSARPDLNRQTRTVDMHFVVDVAAGAPKPFVGQLAELELVRTENRSGYWIPVTALVEGERGLWSVLVIATPHPGSDKTSVTQNAGEPIGAEFEALEIQQVHVDVLYADASSVFIHAGLSETVRVVNDGGHRVVSGQRVTLANGTR